MTDGVSEGADVLGAASGAVLDLAPEVGRWLYGAGAAETIKAVRQAVAQVTGTDDAEAQVRALADPAKATALRGELARIAAGCEGAQMAALQQAVERAAGAAPKDVNRSIAWGVPAVSLTVLVTFGAVVWIALTRSMPAGSEAVLNVLLGTLGAMATSVVGYWVGSSAGSARKDERLASLADRS